MNRFNNQFFINPFWYYTLLTTCRWLGSSWRLDSTIPSCTTWWCSSWIRKVKISGFQTPIKVFGKPVIGGSPDTIIDPVTILVNNRCIRNTFEETEAGKDQWQDRHEKIVKLFDCIIETIINKLHSLCSFRLTSFGSSLSRSLRSAGFACKKD